MDESSRSLLLQPESPRSFQSASARHTNRSREGGTVTVVGSIASINLNLKTIVSQFTSSLASASDESNLFRYRWHIYIMMAWAWAWWYG